ncbi:MAG: ABC transporter ATP-binding protein [Desulfurococcaceae archaeon]
MLIIRELTAGYSRIPVIRNINIDVNKGEIVAILGPNGAGKSTLLNTVLNLTSIFHGVVKFNDIMLNHLKPHEIVKLGIQLVPQSDNVFPNLTVEENLLLGCYIKHDRDEIYNNINEILEIFPELRKRLKQRAKTLSGGERQMLAIARALVSKPTLLLLDEPTSGLAPKAISVLFKKIVEIKDTTATSILFAEQNIMKALEIANRVYVIVGGEIVGTYGIGEISPDTIEKLFFTGRSSGKNASYRSRELQN